MCEKYLDNTQTQGEYKKYKNMLGMVIKSAKTEHYNTQRQSNKYCNNNLWKLLKI